MIGRRLGGSVALGAALLAALSLAATPVSAARGTSTAGRAQTAPDTAPTAPAVSPATTWSSPRLARLGDYFHVSLAIDSHGRLHAAAAGHSGIWYMREMGDGSFERQRVSTNLPGGHDDDPSIALDGAGRPYVAFVRWDCDDCAPNPPKGIYLSKRSGGSWTSPTKLAGRSMVSPSLQIHGGDLYLAYARCECIPKQTAQVWFLTSAGPGAGYTRLMVDEGGGNPSLQVAANGRARIAFDGHGVWVAQAAGKACCFSLLQIGEDTAGTAYPSLALTSDNRSVVAWSRVGGPGRRGIVVTTLTGSTTFSNARASAQRGHPSLALDGSDSPVVAVWRSSGCCWVYEKSGATFAGTRFDDEAVADGMGIVIDGATDERHIAYSAVDGVPPAVYVVDGT
ncbi:MAG: hypothetical protein QOH61_2019 [Chloroflexota bacterium]|nr:hypothetical protein [Chloroflexota bacterium]